MAMVTVRTSDDLRELIIQELKDGVVISVNLSSEEKRNRQDTDKDHHGSLYTAGADIHSGNRPCVCRK